MRCRAGLLNIASWIALANVVVFRERVVLWVLWPVVCVEFLASCTVGLTPLHVAVQSDRDEIVGPSLVEAGHVPDTSTTRPRPVP